jgi:hypothetical protein
MIGRERLSAPVGPSGQELTGVEDVRNPRVATGNGTEAVGQGLLAVIDEAEAGGQVRHQDLPWAGSSG